ncbi:hypothetical protein V3G39_15530 [Dermatophilaceae bacterium Sec6.4]
MQMLGTRADVARTAKLGAAEGVGSVYTIKTDPKNKVKRLQELIRVHDHYTENGVRHILVDASLYDGADRCVGPARLSKDWIDAQLNLGCPAALTDSPFIERDGERALRSVLEQAKDLGPDVVAVLPMHPHWVGTNTSKLIEAINDVGVAVAIILEHSNDPYGSQKTVHGLVRILNEVDQKILVLRCDLSAVGAACFGASVGAIGTTTGLRHIYPRPTKRSGGGFHDPRIGLYVPSAMAYRALDTVSDATIRDTGPDIRWRCPCRYCSGGLLIDTVVDEVSAYEHSFAAIAHQSQQMLGPDSTAEDARRTWVSQCEHAQTLCQEVAYDLGIGWPTPDFFAGWRNAIIDPAPLRMA